LPSIEKIYSLLNNEHVDREEYKTAQKIWDKFNIRNLQEFNNLYNKVDILLIADIMENFRNIALKTYKLHPTYYFTTPVFAWDCMLKMTKQKLELLSDYDMVLMIEKGIRGGISKCSNSNATANNMYMNVKNTTKVKNLFSSNT